MPTITITITIAVPDGDPTNGGDAAADLAAYALTHYAVPAITIDRPVAAPAATRLPSWMSDPLYDLAHPVVATIDAHEAASRVDPARHDHVVANAACPKCGAAIGENCHNNKPGKAHKIYSSPFVHVSRRAAAGSVAPF